MVKMAKVLESENHIKNRNIHVWSVVGIVLPHTTLLFGLYYIGHLYIHILYSCFVVLHKFFSYYSTTNSNYHFSLWIKKSENKLW